MNLRSGFPLLVQQYKALFMKNLLLSWRNKRATFLQLFSSLFFIFLIFCIQEAIQARFSSSSGYKSVTDPQHLVSPAIPPCEDKYYVKFPCFDFIWSGNGSSRVRSIVNAIMANNPGRPIPSFKVNFDDAFEFGFIIHVFGFSENDRRLKLKVHRSTVTNLKDYSETRP